MRVSRGCLSRGVQCIDQSSFINNYDQFPSHYLTWDDIHGRSGRWFPRCPHALWATFTKLWMVCSLDWFKGHVAGITPGFNRKFMVSCRFWRQLVRINLTLGRSLTTLRNQVGRASWNAWKQSQRIRLEDAVSVPDIWAMKIHCGCRADRKPAGWVGLLALLPCKFLPCSAAIG